MVFTNVTTPPPKWADADEYAETLVRKG